MTIQLYKMEITTSTGEKMLSEWAYPKDYIKKLLAVYRKTDKSAKYKIVKA